MNLNCLVKTITIQSPNNMSNLLPFLKIKLYMALTLKLKYWIVSFRRDSFANSTMKSNFRQIQNCEVLK